MIRKSNANAAGNLKAERCAVFRISLDERFVYIDELTEKLLGYASEELFGKPIKDVLTPDSYGILRATFDRGAHYETFFEAAPLTFMKRNSTSHTYNCIISLNFIRKLALKIQ